MHGNGRSEHGVTPTSYRRIYGPQPHAKRSYAVKPKTSLITFALLLSSAAATGRAEVTVRDPGTFVVDRANLIDARTRQRMEGWLRELEKKTGAQIKVLTVPTTDGESIFDFTQRHAELWKLGRKDVDDGVLITVALKERKDRIQVGYGLEGVLPDVWCNSVRQQIIIPAFKQRRFSDGLYRATLAITNRVAESKNVSLTGMPKSRHRGRRARPGGVACGGGMIPIMLLFIIISSRRRRRGYGRWGGGGGLFTGMMLGGMMGRGLGGRSHWGGGGGFGSGGFGGFGGGSFGGGGGFGGGGAGGGGW